MPNIAFICHFMLKCLCLKGGRFSLCYALKDEPLYARELLADRHVINSQSLKNKMSHGSVLCSSSKQVRASITQSNGNGHWRGNSEELGVTLIIPIFSIHSKQCICQNCSIQMFRITDKFYVRKVLY